MAREDPEYLAKVRRLPCAAHAAGGCSGRIEAHHVRVRQGMGSRAHDWLAVPLCEVHHRQEHDGGGPFGAMSADERRAWWRDSVEETLRAVREGVGPEWF